MKLYLILVPSSVSDFWVHILGVYIRVYKISLFNLFENGTRQYTVLFSDLFSASTSANNVLMGNCLLARLSIYNSSNKNVILYI